MYSVSAGLQLALQCIITTQGRINTFLKGSPLFSWERWRDTTSVALSSDPGLWRSQQIEIFSAETTRQPLMCRPDASVLTALLISFIPALHFIYHMWVAKYRASLH